MMFFSLLLFIGCEDYESNSKGGYVEEDYSFPETIQDILDMTILDDGKVAVIGRKCLENTSFGDIINEELRYYESSDKGKSWKEKKLRIPKKNIDKLIEYEDCKILDDGSFIFSIREFTQEEIDNLDIRFANVEDVEKYNGEINKDNTARIVRGDSNGNLTEVPRGKLEKNKYKILVSDDKYVYLIRYYPAEIIQFDVYNEEVTNCIKLESDHIGPVAINNNKIFVNDYEKVLEYNIKNSSKEGENKVLTKKSPYNLNYYSGINNKTIYIVGQEGVYSYTGGSKVIEKLIDGSITAFGDKDNYLEKFLEVSDNEFICAFLNKENNKIELKHYYYDKDADFNPNK